MKLKSGHAMKLTPPKDKQVYVNVTTGNDANSGLSTYSPVRTIARACEIQSDRRGKIAVNFCSLECCDAPDFKAYALLVDVARAPRSFAIFELRVHAALSWMRFIAVCKNCGAEWMPIEATETMGNFLVIDDLVVEGCL